MRSFFVRFIAIGVLFHLYVGMRIIPDAFASPLARTIAALVLASFVVLIPVGMFSRRFDEGWAATLVGWAGALAMGFFSSLLVLTFVRDIVLLGVLAWRHLGHDGAWSGAAPDTALGVLAAAVLVTAIGFVGARRTAAVKRVSIPIAGLPAALDGLTIVQLSDIHVGPTIKRPYIERIVRAVNALDADLVAVTGDVVDGSVKRLREHTAPLGQMRSRHGTFLVTGNHEYYAGAHAWIDEFRRIGLTVLLNEHVLIERGGARGAGGRDRLHGGGASIPRIAATPRRRWRVRRATSARRSCSRTSRAARRRRTARALPCSCRGTRMAASSCRGRRSYGCSSR